MSTRYNRFQNGFNVSSNLVGKYLKELYPNITSAYAVVYAGAGDPLDPPNDTMRVFRSRGRHQPGSGDYFCSHVYSRGRVSGWVISRVAYVTSFPYLSRYINSTNYEFYELHSNGKTHDYGSVTWRNGYLSVNRVRMVYDHLDTRGKAVYNQYSAYRRWQIAIPPSDFSSYVWMIQPEDWVQNSPITYSYWFDAPFPGNMYLPEWEDTFLRDKVEFHTFPSFDSYLNEAYVRAFSSLPAITTNNIQNLIMIKDALFAALKAASGNMSGLTGLGNLSDAWLGYRYSYCTTKSDIQEIAAYCNRMSSFRRLNTVTGHGSYRISYGSESYEIRCSVETRVVDYLNVYDEVARLGLALDAYNLWDLIPYSFILDWFLHIGDLLEKARSRNQAIKISPSAVWFSITHDFVNSSGADQCDYYRWLQDDTKFMSSCPAAMFSSQAGSLTTWVKRGADAVALLT